MGHRGPSAAKPQLVARVYIVASGTLKTNIKATSNDLPPHLESYEKARPK